MCCGGRKTKHDIRLIVVVVVIIIMICEYLKSCEIGRCYFRYVICHLTVNLFLCSTVARSGSSRAHTGIVVVDGGGWETIPKELYAKDAPDGFYAKGKRLII